MMPPRNPVAGEDITDRSANWHRLLFALALSLFVHGGLVYMDEAFFRRPFSSSRESRALTLSISLSHSIQLTESVPSQITSRSVQLPGTDSSALPSAHTADDSLGVSETAIDETRYYSPSEVDQRAEFFEGRTDFGPDDGLADQTVPDASFLVLLLIDSDGHVDKAIANVDTDLSRKAVDAIQGWRFRPAIKNGTEVPSSKLIELTLEPSFG